jgi:enamine deaminase RidA (YjgF/YER057c/UK114 family)
MADSKNDRDDALPVPISLTRRAGDFVFVSGLGDHYFTPEDVTFDAVGAVLDDGSGMGPRAIEEQTRSVFQRVAAALEGEGCGLADVVEMTVWLSDPRDFMGFNETYKEFFREPHPTRAVVRADFMFDALVEVKVTAYKPRDKPL